MNYSYERLDEIANNNEVYFRLHDLFDHEEIQYLNFLGYEHFVDRTPGGNTLEYFIAKTIRHWSMKGMTPKEIFSKLGMNQGTTYLKQGCMYEL